MAYDNTNTGLLKRNDRKEKDSHPDYRGTINIDGTDYWLSGWLKVGREGTKLAGQKFFSLSVTPMEDQQTRGGNRPAAPSRQQARQQARHQPAPRQADPLEDDDIPF
jgi:hypothetical protein